MVENRSVQCILPGSDFRLCVANFAITRTRKRAFQYFLALGRGRRSILEHDDARSALGFALRGRWWRLTCSYCLIGSAKFLRLRGHSSFPNDVKRMENEVTSAVAT